jgi:hypothetical protein
VKKVTEAYSSLVAQATGAILKLLYRCACTHLGNNYGHCKLSEERNIVYKETPDKLYQANANPYFPLAFSNLSES